MSATYDWYFKALELAGDCGELTRDQIASLGVSEGDARPGFYRKRKFKSGPFLPVAIWHDGEKMIAVVGIGNISDVTDPDEIWTFCCRNPVSEATYRAVVDGADWPDAAPGIGHNSGSDDPAEALRDQIDAALANVKTFAKIEDDEKQAKAQSARARLNELSSEADKIRKREKEPHLEAGRAVDAKFQPLVKDAKAGADAIGKAMSAYETAKARAAAEARRKAEEEARKREEEARKAAEVGKPAPAPVAVPEPEPEPVTTTIKGGYGRAASVRVVRVATVVDQDKAYHAMKTHPELVALIAKLAQRAIDKNIEIDGVTVDEQRRVA